MSDREVVWRLLFRDGYYLSIMKTGTKASDYFATGKCDVTYGKLLGTKLELVNSKVSQHFELSDPDSLNQIKEYADKHILCDGKIVLVTKEGYYNGEPFSIRIAEPNLQGIHSLIEKGVICHIKPSRDLGKRGREA